MLGGGVSFLVSSTRSSQETNLIRGLESLRKEAERNHKKSIFYDEGLMEDVMPGLFVDPRFPAITFVTPSSWIFHAIQYSAACRFSIVSTVSLRVFSSSYVRELVLLYTRALYASQIFQENQELSTLLNLLDISFRQAEKHQNTPFVNSGYINDLDYFDDTRCVNYFDHFYVEQFSKVTVHSLFVENEEKANALQTHQAGFFLNSALVEKDIDRAVQNVYRSAFHQEYFRFSTMLSAPIVVGHEIGVYHRLSRFLDSEMQHAKEIRAKLAPLSVEGTYTLPMISSKEYAKGMLHTIMGKVASSSSSSLKVEKVKKEKKEKSPKKTEKEEKEENVEKEEEKEEKKEEEEEEAKSELKVPPTVQPPEPIKQEQRIADEEAGSCQIM